MQRLCLSLLIAMLVLPAAALAGVRAAGDGTLVVRDAVGKVSIARGSGTIFGHIDQGRLFFDDVNSDDTALPQVFGAERTIPSFKDDSVMTYIGKNIRFRFFGGAYAVRLNGTGIDVSAVGHGTATFTGLGVPPDGDYGDFAKDGGKFVPISAFPTTVTFGAAAP
jgi:hypothetical protein